MKTKRVVVTGLGVISSVGIGIDAFWQSIIEGKSGISAVSSFETKDFRCHRAGEIRHFNAAAHIPPRNLRFFGKTSQLAIAATAMAFKDARLTPKKFPKGRIGIFIGTTMGEKPLEESISTWIKEGAYNIKKMTIVQSTANNISSNIGVFFRINGPNFLIPNACAAGNFAIGYGFDLIRRGELDCAIVGGADSFSKTAFSGFHRLYAMAPEKCQPFDKNRKGMMVGEGAGILILEKLDSALERNAEIYAEIGGYGLSCDAHHITSPKTEGIEKALRKALVCAGIEAKDVDYISAHGTGTPANDKAECAAIRRVFKDELGHIPVSSIKSMIGHTMGAASAIESCACCMAVKHDILPPTMNFETKDPDCDIDCVPNKARPKTVNVLLKDSFAFGGNNCSLVIKKYSAS